MNSFFAIRHRPTGRFLPALNSYGFTRCEPSATDPPRLFSRQSSASQALNWWLEGEVYEVIQEDLDSPGPERSVSLRTFRRPNRKRDDMEIVCISLSIKTLEQAQLDRL